MSGVIMCSRLFASVSFCRLVKSTTMSSNTVTAREVIMHELKVHN